MKKVFNIGVMTVIILLMSAMHVLADWKLAGEERVLNNLVITIVIETAVCAMILFAYSRKKNYIAAPILVLVILACTIVISTVGNPFDFNYSRSSTWIKIITELVMYVYSMIWSENIRDGKAKLFYMKTSENIQYANEEEEQNEYSH